MTEHKQMRCLLNSLKLQKKLAKLAVLVAPGRNHTWINFNSNNKSGTEIYIFEKLKQSLSRMLSLCNFFEQNQEQKRILMF